MKQELIPLTSPYQWKDALQNINHAFGHTWENCYAMHLTTGYKTFLYKFERGNSKILCPIAERNYLGHVDIVTPYGFSGFIGNYDLPDFPNIWKTFVEDIGYVSGFIGLNPLLGNKIYLPVNELYQYSTLYVLDLKLSISELFQRLSQNRKRELRNFNKRLHEFTTDKTILKKFFLANYHQFLNVKNASQTYNFSNHTLNYLLDLEQVLLVGFVENGRVRAVSLFAYTTYIGEYLFNVSLHGAQSQTSALLWFGITYLKSLNVPWLNLGGGVKEGDTIAQFKQRFGPIDLPLRCLKQVYNKTVYSQLCQNVKKDPDDRTGYFPIYRDRPIHKLG